MRRPIRSKTRLSIVSVQSSEDNFAPNELRCSSQTSANLEEQRQQRSDGEDDQSTEKTLKDYNTNPNSIQSHVLDCQE